MITVIHIIAFFFLILGLIFRVFKPVDVLSGISAENLRDRDGFGKWVGNSLIIFSLVYGALAGGLHLLEFDLSSTSTTMDIGVGAFLFCQGLIVSYIMGTGKFTKTTALPLRPLETDVETVVKD
jgi:hypothetical protein